MVCDNKTLALFFSRDQPLPFPLPSCFNLYIFLILPNIQGQFLAVGWSDGVVRLMGLESNKAAHHIEVCPGSEARITHIGWACSTIQSKDASIGQGIPTEKGTSPEIAVKDLPRELMFLEVDTALPRISPLPASSAGSG